MEGNLRAKPGDAAASFSLRKVIRFFNGATSQIVHTHSINIGDDQSHWIVSGQFELTIENFGTVLLEAGDRDFMPAETYHSARVIGEEPVIYLIGEKKTST